MIFRVGRIWPLPSCISRFLSCCRQRRRSKMPITIFKRKKNATDTNKIFQTLHWYPASEHSRLYERFVCSHQCTITSTMVDKWRFQIVCDQRRHIMSTSTVISKSMANRRSSTDLLLLLELGLGFRLGTQASPTRNYSHRACYLQIWSVVKRMSCKYIYRSFALHWLASIWLRMLQYEHYRLTRMGESEA